MRGDFTVIINGEAYVFSDFFLGQGHTDYNNNWWIGSRECRYIDKDNLTCSSIDESGNTVKFKFDQFDEDTFYIEKVD